MTISSLRLIGLATGMAMGSALALLFAQRDPQTPRALSNQAPITLSPAQGVIQPTLDDVCDSSQKESAEVLLHYLEEASIDEVIALMERVAQGETELGTLMWVIQTRALELDSQATLAWAQAHRHRYPLLLPLYRRWAVMDPEAALVASQQDEEWYNRVETIIATQYGDIDRAIEATAALGSGNPLVPDFEKIRVLELALSDVHAALDEVLSRADPFTRKLHLDAVMDAWINREPLAAMAWIEKQDGLAERDALLEQAIGKIAKTEPQLARMKFEELPPSKGKSLLEGTLMKEWAAQDPDAAFDWLKTLPSGNRRDQLFAYMAHKSKSTPEELLTLALAMGIDLSQTRATENGTRESGALIEKMVWAVRDLATESPEKALNAMFALNNLGDSRTDSLGRDWARSAPESAAAWVVQLPESDIARDLQEEVFLEWAEQSPDLAAEFLKRHGLMSSKDATPHVVRQWAKKDPAAALRWIDQLEDNIQETFWQGAIYPAGKADPILTLQYMNRIEDPKLYDSALRTAVSSWRQQDPEAALGWLAAQPSEAQVAELYQHTITEWVSEQPVEASEWIGHMEVGPQKDHAVIGLLNALISEENFHPDFEAAEIWTRTLSDPVLQNEWESKIRFRR